MAEFYFHLHVTEVHRPLTWDELRGELDAGHPPIAGLYMGGGMGHAVVMFGYAEPDFIFIHDPVRGPIWTRYWALKSGADYRGQWYMTWEMAPSDRTIFGSAEMPAPLAHATQGPGKSTVTATFPSLKAGHVLKAVSERVDQEAGSLRSCYEQGLTATPPADPKAAVTISFLVDHGSPMLLRVTDQRGITPEVKRCLTDTVARWSGLFPSSGGFDDSQKIHLEFVSLTSTAQAAH